MLSDRTEGWDAATTTGRDKLEDILKQQRPWMTTLISAQRGDSGHSRTVQNAERWSGIASSGHVGCADPTPSRGNFCLSTWHMPPGTLEGVFRVTVGVCALGMADASQQLHRKTTTLVTNDAVVADAFRPCRCERSRAGHSHGRSTHPKSPRVSPSVL